ncbi:MAG: hypothetical protein E7166_05060 [Firmicutes bacterium]|nr:hypothetical protein [Bacillota bacterium]
MDLILIGKTAEQICDGDMLVIMGVVKSVLTIIQIAVPILLIIMGSLDLMKAVMAGKEDEIKKAQGTFVKRAIAAVIVFFIPLIVSLVIGLLPAGKTNHGVELNYKACWDADEEKICEADGGNWSNKTCNYPDED